MPATTRSKTKQARLEDFGAGDSRGESGSKNATSGKTTKSEGKEFESKDSAATTKAKQNKAKKDAPANKRKSTDSNSDDQSKKSRPAKRRHVKAEPEPEPEPSEEKQSQLTKSGEVSPPDTDAPEHKPIMINRAPVLQLWSASVAHRLYPELSWETCLAIGSAISTLCAISKGRSIGMIDPPDTADEERKRRKEAQKRRDEAGADDEVQVMGFRLLVKGEDVLLQGKPKHGSEAPLKGKFGGDDDYQRVKDAMDTALARWTGDEESKKELNKRAFHMYESFRPTVQSGQGGWGRKGPLSIDKIKDVVERK
ncbi:hypothetical protein ABEF93_006328 [Exophiala dermatitidis]